MELLGQGLILTAVGLGVVFSFLGILVLATHLLGRWVKEPAISAPLTAPSNAPSAPAPIDPNSEVAVAITAAVHTYRAAQRG